MVICYNTFCRKIIDLSFSCIVVKQMGSIKLNTYCTDLLLKNNIQIPQKQMLLDLVSFLMCPANQSVIDKSWLEMVFCVWSIRLSMMKEREVVKLYKKW
jgi:hypothetical protein